MHRFPAVIDTQRERVVRMRRWLMLAALACLLAPVAGWAQAVRVEDLLLAGKQADQVDAVLVITADAPQGMKRRVRRNDQFVAGFEIVAPPGVVIVLRSANGNRIVLEPGAHVRVSDVTQAGERYVLRIGSVLFDVLKALSFFNVEFDETFSAQVRGTVFRVTGDKRDGVPRFTCEVERGQVLVKRPERLQVGERRTVIAQTAVLLGAATQPKVVWGKEDVERVRRFASLEEAEGYVRERLIAARAEAIDVALALGTLASASGDSERALRIYQGVETGNALDPRVAELYVRTGDLLARAGKRDAALQRYDLARKTYNTIYTPNASKEVAAVLSREGDVYHQRGQQQLAVRKYRESERAIRRANVVNGQLLLQQQIDPDDIKIQPRMRPDMLRQPAPQ